VVNVGFGLGLLMTAAGAVLIWAVNYTSSDVNLHTVGWVLFVIGIVGIALSLIFWQSLGGLPGGFAHGRRRTTMDEQGRMTEEQTTTY